jgi:hypothetical protein
MQGMFLQVQQCSVLLLFQKHGCIVPAPYTDEYGETDMQLVCICVYLYTHTHTHTHTHTQTYLYMPICICV